MKKYEARQAYIILSQAKLDGLTAEEKRKVINVARSMKKASDDFEDFIKETQEKVKDAGEANTIISQEAETEAKLNIEKLGETFDKMVDNNSWNVAQIILLEDFVK